MHRTTGQFWQRYDELPEEVRRVWIGSHDEYERILKGR
jgi:hypothetical protein